MASDTASAAAAGSSSSSIEADAETVFEYHKMGMPPQRPVDAVFCLCSLDVRVAHRAAVLFLTGYGDRFLIFSGGVGKLTQGRFAKPEAEMFADIAREMGVPDDKIIVENRSTNTGENVRFVWDLLEQRRVKVQSFVLVQKPYMERRTYATFKKQWPDPETVITVTSPQIDWRDYPDVFNPRELVVNIMVGDLVRIREYPAKGFQIHQDIPDEVWDAGQRLIKAGYSRHLP
ncbi:hypothetical protein PG993_014401 [Apiospora rasikravindrae]|uniref:DUF218 domain-containing protein n=1 Tax=Apiospora rasikravindrae TaxID=990691 RepID=A0ABR1RMY1_9PEZI